MGARKTRVFYTTLMLNNVIILLAMMAVHISMTAQDVVTLTAINSGLSVAFFGANSLEHKFSPKP